MYSFASLSFEGEQIISEFVEQYRIIEYTSALRPIISIRKTYKLQMADAIIAATSLHLNIPLLTFDKGFLKIKELTFVDEKF